MAFSESVLITSAAAKVQLVRSFRDALAGRAKVFTADVTQACAAAYCSDQHFVVLQASAPGATEQLIDLCVRHGVGLLVPTRDGELASLAKARDRFLASGVFVHVASLEAIELCQNKRAFSGFLVAQGLPSVPMIDQVDQATPFPLFIRPVTGSAGKGARRVASYSEYQALSRAGDFLVHPIIDAPEYSIDLLMDLQGRRALEAVCRQRIQVVAGESKISRVEDLPELAEMVKRLGESLRLVGHNTVQAFLDPLRGPLLIEVNPRFGGASNLSIQAGLDSPRRIVQMLRDDPEAGAPRSIRFGAVMYRYSEDVIVGLC